MHIQKNSLLYPGNYIDGVMLFCVTQELKKSVEYLSTAVEEKWLSLELSNVSMVETTMASSRRDRRTERIECLVFGLVGFMEYTWDTRLDVKI